MHVGGLKCDQGTKRGGLAQNRMRNDPRIEQAVVGEDQHARAAGVLAPSRDGLDAPQVFALCDVLRLWTCRKNHDCGVPPSPCQRLTASPMKSYVPSCIPGLRISPAGLAVLPSRARAIRTHSSAAATSAPPPRISPTVPGRMPFVGSPVDDAFVISTSCVPIDVRGWPQGDANGR